MKKNKWKVDISLMNGNQQHYHFSLTPELFDLIREAAAETVIRRNLPDGLLSELEEPLDKMLQLSDVHLSKIRETNEEVF